MGSFYTQMLVGERSTEKCASAMTELRRSSFVIPATRNVSVICDKDVERQDLQTIDSLAMALSSRLSCTVVALLNHDDDWLVMRYFECGHFVGGLQVGHTGFSLRGSFSQLRRLLNPRASLIGLFLALVRPVVVQLDRHKELARILDLPPCSVGLGYKYIRSDGLVPEFMKLGVIET
jgi:hypothetical protein